MEQTRLRSSVHPSARPARFAGGGAHCRCGDCRRLLPIGCGKGLALVDVEIRKPQPGRMTVVWTHATEIESNREMRGFRGRIFFYRRRNRPRRASRLTKRTTNR